MIIVDENVEQYWINLLKGEGYPILNIKEKHPQLSDTEITKLAKQHKGILITEDKDFGELVFSHGITGLTVIFLRYDQPQYELIRKQVLTAVSKYHEADGHFFITITKRNTRVRKL